MNNKNTTPIPEIDDMTIESYKAILDAVISLSCDADGYGLFEHISDEDVEKCKWIAAICEVMDDVPKRRMEHIFKYREVKFDFGKFLEEYVL